MDEGTGRLKLMLTVGATEERELAQDRTYVKESDGGYSYKSSDVSYYTEKIEDGYFYFEAVY